MKKLLLFLAILFYNFSIGQSIISVTPNNGNKGQNLEVIITAQNTDFYSSSPTINVSFIDQFSNIIPVSTFYCSEGSNQLYAFLSIPGYAIPGLYGVHVSESGGAFDMTLTNGFTVNNAYTYSIQGNIHYDSNNNGCDALDANLPNQRIAFFNGPTVGNFYANETGSYTYYDVDAGSNSFSPILENPSYFTVSPASASVVLSTTNNLFVQDFCIAPNGIHNDLEVSLVDYGSSRPGFNSSYLLIYKNKGTQLQNGTINLSFDDAVMDLVNANPATASQGTNILSWNFSNLLPFESRNIFVTMHINSGVMSPPVNVGDILTFTATVNGATDETPINNTSHLNETVVGSYDPNDKTCAEGHLLPISDVGKYLHYIIRFENTGTANAENIVVSDVIDTSKFDITSLVPISGSRSFTTKITNTNLVQFIFENINLPFDNANNDGYVAFKIKPKATLTAGSNISNTANIYFDYNTPITTNTYVTTVFNPLAITDFDFGSVFALSPVPAKSFLTITTKVDVIVSAVTIYNALGQLVLENINSFETIDVSALKIGTYFIKIVSDKGTACRTFIKE